MTVRELIEILEEQDPEAEVILLTQRNYPFECALTGVTSREELHLADGDDDGEEEELAPGLDLTDVFLLEGQQLRYGSKRAWEVAGY